MSPEDETLLYKVIYTSVFVPLLLCGLLMWFLIYYQKKKHQSELREKELIIQKQTALQSERTRIAAEMHDDLGGGLTTIKFLGQKMLRKIDNLEQKSQLNKIVNNSQALVSNMSEIIWAMNAGFDTLESLVAYCRRYASEYLRDHDIGIVYEALESNGPKVEVSGEKRRHIFLVFKELLHNIVKHAEAKQVQVIWTLDKEQLVLSVKDNGNELSSGNGLRNMQQRIEQLGGTISWTDNEGTLTEIKMPISSLNSYGTV